LDLDSDRLAGLATCSSHCELRESRSRELRRDRGEPRPRALVDSFNLYFGEFHEGQELAKNLEDIEALFGTESYFKAKINPYGVIFEFGRQLAQLREADSSTETTFTKFAKKIAAWLNRALKSLRLVAISIDSEGGVLDGTALQAMILDMEQQMRKRNDRINGLSPPKKQSW
jgi:hypothetical protein